MLEAKPGTSNEPIPLFTFTVYWTLFKITTTSPFNPRSFIPRKITFTVTVSPTLNSFLLTYTLNSVICALGTS